MGLTSSAVSAASAAGSTLGSAAASSVEAILESPASYIPPPYQSYSSNADVAIPCIRPEVGKAMGGIDDKLINPACPFRVTSTRMISAAFAEKTW